ncbi:MAG: N-acetylmuramoyl-L-alanine amidase [Actinomycetota bacterium]
MAKDTSRRSFLMASAGGVAAVAMARVGPSAGAAPAVPPAPGVTPGVGEVRGPLDGTELRALPFPAHHVALYWPGSPDAVVRVELSVDGVSFGPVIDAGRDEVGRHRGNGETYGALIAAGGARFARVTTDRPLPRLSVLALDVPPTVGTPDLAAAPIAAAITMPTVISRAGWGADESWRFTNGSETWPPDFYPVQKLVVHHTAGANGDPNPAATVRSIYQYHCVTQGWGDIGYTFLIDEQGRIYKGRNSHAPGDPNGDTITGENTSGAVVTAGHSLGVNQGSVGVALLGTLTSVDATTAAKGALTDLLAWECDRHSIDPYGITRYVDPDGITSSNTPTQPIPNILGHRDVSATACPGDTFYPKLPAVRDAVAARIGAPPDTTPPTAPALNTVTWVKNKFVLSWSASTDTGSGVAGYEVYRATASGGPFTLLGTTSQTTFGDGNVGRLKSFWYFVKAFDRAGLRSVSSNTVAVTRR